MWDMMQCIFVFYLYFYGSHDAIWVNEKNSKSEKGNQNKKADAVFDVRESEDIL